MDPDRQTDGRTEGRYGPIGSYYVYNKLEAGGRHDMAFAPAS